MASFIGLVAIFYIVVVAPFLTTFVNSQPNALEGVPDEWAVHTWSNGQEEAMYNSQAEDCTLIVSKTSTPEHQVMVNMSLICNRENGSSHHVSRSDNLDGDEHTFIIEPADFDFVVPVAEECGLSFGYGSDWRYENVEDIHAAFHCERHE